MVSTTQLLFSKWGVFEKKNTVCVPKPTITFLMDDFLILNEDFHINYRTFIHSRNNIKSTFQQYVFEWMSHAYNEKASSLTSFVVYIFSCQMLDKCKALVNHKEFSPPLLRVLEDIFCESGRLKPPPRSALLPMFPEDLIPKTLSCWFEPFTKVFDTPPEFSEEGDVYGWIFNVYRSSKFSSYCESLCNDTQVKHELNLYNLKFLPCFFVFPLR